MVTHFSILAWEIPRTEEPGGLYRPWGRKESNTIERLTTTAYPMSPRRWDSFLVESNIFVAAGNNSASFPLLLNYFKQPFICLWP